MRLSRPNTRSKRASRSRRDSHDRPTAPSARERNQRANISQDAALYACSCGYIFKAPVTTSVGCPHCGADQAW
jgi:rubrerythrin